MTTHVTPKLRAGEVRTASPARCGQSIAVLGLVAIATAAAITAASYGLAYLVDKTTERTTTKRKTVD